MHHADAGAARLGDLVDDLAVRDGVHLEEAERPLAGAGLGDLAVQAAHDERLQADRRDAERVVLALEVADLQVAEEAVRVLADVRLDGHE